MKAALIISDAVHLVNAGADLDRVVHVFELPEHIADLIREAKDGDYTTISFALVSERFSS